MDPEREKRVRVYKPVIVTVFFVTVLIPVVLCIILLFQINSLRNEIKTIAAIRDEYYQDIQRQQQLNNNSDLQQQDNDKTAQEEQHQNQQQILNDINDENGNGKSMPSYTEPASTGDLEEINTDTTVPPAVNEPSDTRKKVYLTFDDGPSSNTNAILDILKEYNAKATFFVNAKSRKTYEDTYKRIVDEGHALAMHSYAHVYADVYASVEAFAQDTDKLRDYLYDITGVESNIYRFPGGSSNSITKIDIRKFGAVLAEKNIVYFDWNVSSGDAVSPILSADEIYNNVTSAAVKKKTPVVLMHDLAQKKTTVEALPMILQFFIDNDYDIVAIDENVEPVQHVKLDK